MRLRALPGYSALLLDYVEDAPSVRPFLSFHPDRETLLSHAAQATVRRSPRDAVCKLLSEQAAEFQSGEQVRENIRLLREPGTAVVLTSLAPSILGGPLCLLLRCLSAAKLARELSRAGVPSVPLAWIQTEDSRRNSACSLSLLNADSKLARLSLDESVPDPSEETLQRILQIASPNWDSEVVDILRGVLARGTRVALASAAFLALLVDAWGVVFLDPRKPGYQALAADAAAPLKKDPTKTLALLGERSAMLAQAGYDSPQRPSAEDNDENAVETCLVQNSVLPVAVLVAGSSDLHGFSLAVPFFQEIGQAPPLPWPRVSATLVDARNRKILEKYKLVLEDLFAGQQEVLRRTGLREAEHQAASSFDALIAGIESRIQKMAALAPDEGLEAEVRSSRERILYQLGKLKDRFVSASIVRREAAIRQLERSCNSLAPESQPQERKLGALHFLLRYSCAIIPRIYDKITVWSHDHQIIDMD